MMMMEFPPHLTDTATTSNALVKARPLDDGNAHDIASFATNFQVGPFGPGRQNTPIRLSTSQQFERMHM